MESVALAQLLTQMPMQMAEPLMTLVVTKDHPTRMQTLTQTLTLMLTPMETRTQTIQAEEVTGRFPSPTHVMTRVLRPQVSMEHGQFGSAKGHPLRSLRQHG
jgi:hypothetical protein